LLPSLEKCKNVVFVTEKEVSKFGKPHKNDEKLRICV